MFEWLCYIQNDVSTCNAYIEKGRTILNFLYQKKVYDTRRDYGSATSKLEQKYAEIALFELFYPHFIFCVDEHGYREKVTKQFRTVRIVIELDCGNT